MKYLLKFKIKTWGGYVRDDEEHDFIIKVEFIDEMVKKEGFFIVERGYFNEPRIILYLKSCEVVEGPTEIHDKHSGNLVFNFWKNDCQDYLVRSLDVHRECASANFMGMEPVADEESQPISSPEEGE